MSKLLTLQMPANPEPVPVTLNVATTALLVFDVVEDIASRQPVCKTKMLPVITALLARARKAGVTVGYGTRAHNKLGWLPEVAPQPGDIQIESKAQDRFYSTELDNILKGKGITTLILVGWKVSGSVTYTSVGATLRAAPSSSRSTRFGRHRLRDRHRAVPDFASEQRRCRERALEEPGFDAEPHRSDHLQVAVEAEANPEKSMGRCVPSALGLEDSQAFRTELAPLLLHAACDLIHIGNKLAAQPHHVRCAQFGSLCSRRLGQHLR